MSNPNPKGIFLFHQPRIDGAGVKYWSANMRVGETTLQVLAHGEEHAKEIVTRLSDALEELQTYAMEYARSCAEAGVPFGRGVKK